MNRRELFAGVFASALGAVAAKLGVKAIPRPITMRWKKYTAKTKISPELYGDGGFMVREDLAQKLGEMEDRHFLTGCMKDDV